ncbi:MAG: AAA family ATPase [Candidatus Methylomirabilales bacterium]
MDQGLARLRLRFNPFEPAASGAPTGPELWIPNGWKTMAEQLLTMAESGHGPKAMAVVGEYGSGKTYLLNWLATQELPRRRIHPYYFDNPGVHFYDLANSLLRRLGRLSFAKSLWELLRPEVSGQRALFDEELPFLVASRRGKGERLQLSTELQRAIQKHAITGDEEIARKLARLIVETWEKPYFEYRDFVAGHKEALVAEREEAPYFKAILRALRAAQGIEAVAFLIDEFEEVSLQKRLTRRDAHDYLATLKRLLNLTQDENFWVIVAMTHQAQDVTKQLEPTLWERFTSHGRYTFVIPPLRDAEARELVKRRVEWARTTNGSEDSLFPFPENFDTALQPSTRSSPRRLVKVAFYCIAEGARTDRRIDLPLRVAFIREVEERIYPGSERATDDPAT